MKPLELIGQRFFKLIVVGISGKNRQGNITWLCRCDCGNEKTFSGDHLTRKIHPIKSCRMHKKNLCS